jgi:dTDP-L-rhamnose 4-epimerase
VLDNLEPQVHGAEGRLPEYWNKKAEFINGDVRSTDDWDRALAGVDAVIHLAAAVGVGQSMYEIRKYMEVNVLGTAILMDKIANGKTSVKKVVTASSMSTYGEGAYSCQECGQVCPDLRQLEQMRAHDWEIKCPQCGQTAKPVQTPESKPLQPTSVYAISKRDQEELCMVVGKSYGIPTVALRYFNIYGPRQALSNPYTGVVAIFSSRLLNGQYPLVFEDGRQSRDFIQVDDVVKANLLALERKEADYHVVNIGTGRSLTLLELCDALGKATKQTVEPRIIQKFREGDIRYCYADTTKAEKVLGFKASVLFEDGIDDLVKWLKHQSALDRVERATLELEDKGLIK